MTCLSEAQRQLDRRDAQRSNWSGTERWCEVFRQGAASSPDVRREAQWLGARRGSGALSSVPQEQATFPGPPARTKEPDGERLSPLGPGLGEWNQMGGKGRLPSGLRGRLPLLCGHRADWLPTSRAEETAATSCL